MNTLETSGHSDDFVRGALPPASAWPTFVRDLPELTYPARLNAAVALLDETAARGPERPCVHAPGGVWSYRDLVERSNRIAAVLRDDLGLVPGNRVLLRAPNSAEQIACWFAVLKAGGVVVATMPMLRAPELVKVIEKARITHALTDARLTEDLEVARETQPGLAHVLSFGPGGELEQRIADKPAAFAPVDTAADDPALIAFTSGTTGQPKGCVHDHRDLLAVCDTFARRIIDPQPDDVFTGTPPIAFTFGLGGLVLFPLRFGASTVPIERPGPRALLDAIRAHGITTVFTAPTAYRSLLREAEDADLASLRTCVAAGEPLALATSDAWFERTGRRLVDGIGATEMLHIFISSPPDEIRPGATGRPVPGYEAMVVDERMQPLPAGQIGRLAVRGPTGCRYLDDPRQAEYVVDGWNVTGDAYLVDEDGYFWFQARGDDMIVSSGYNISGPEVETALLAHPAVAECAVVASPDPERGHVPKAFVVLDPGTIGDDQLVRTLQDHVKAVIAPYKYPRRIAFVDELPRTATGKVQRFRLREQERDGIAAG